MFCGRWDLTKAPCLGHFFRRFRGKYTASRRSASPEEEYGLSQPMRETSRTNHSNSNNEALQQLMGDDTLESPLSLTRPLQQSTEAEPSRTDGEGSSPDPIPAPAPHGDTRQSSQPTGPNAMINTLATTPPSRATSLNAPPETPGPAADSNFKKVRNVSFSNHSEDVVDAHPVCPSPAALPTRASPVRGIRKSRSSYGGGEELL